MTQTFKELQQQIRWHQNEAMRLTQLILGDPKVPVTNAAPQVKVQDKTADEAGAEATSRLAAAAPLNDRHKDCAVVCQRSISRGGDCIGRCDLLPPLNDKGQTPRTDAVDAAWHAVGDKGLAFADLARQLERELAEANLKLVAKRPYSNKLAQEVIEGQVKEIDRLTKLVQDLRSAHSKSRQTNAAPQGTPNAEAVAPAPAVAALSGTVCDLRRFACAIEDADDCELVQHAADLLEVLLKEPHSATEKRDA